MRTCNRLISKHQQMDNAREMEQDEVSGPVSAEAVAAVLLAAGASSRFGPQNKLLAELDGETLVARVAGALLASRVAEVVVVAPADTSAIAAALEGHRMAHSHRLRIVANPDPGRGIASSIAAGIGALPSWASSAMIVPGDMPGMRASICDELISTFAASGCDAVVHAATPDGNQRNPVIWPKRLFASLMALEGDVGGKALIAAERAMRPNRVIAVAYTVSDIFLDVDEPNDLRRWR